MKDIKYILKRVIIGVGIALILMLIKGNFLMVANAQTNENNISYLVPVNSPVENLNNIYYSNFADFNNQLNPLIINSRGTYQIRSLDDPTNIYSIGYTDYGAIPITSYGLPGMAELYGSNNDWVRPYSTLDHIEFKTPIIDDSTNFKLLKNQTYSILIEFNKNNNLTFYQNSDIIQLTNDSVNFKFFKSGDRLTSYNENYITINRLRWISPSSIDNNSGAPNLAYIYIEFSLDSSLPTYDYYFQEISFDVGTIPGINASQVTPFIFNTNNNGLSYSIKSFSFIENGTIQVNSSGNNIVGSLPGMDITTQNDLEIKNSLRSCSNTDIVCHLQNLMDLLFDILVRIGNFFTGIITAFTNLLSYLFVPDLALLSDHFTDLKDLLADKFGFMTSSFNIFTYFKDAFLEIESSDTISFPGVTMPIWNVQLVPAFSYSFSSILSNEILNQAHNVLYIVLNGLLILGFVKFCYNNLMEILGGFNNDIG